MSKTLSGTALEQVFDLIATSIDDAGVENERAFLATLALALAQKTGSVSDVADAVAAAKRAIEE